MADHESTRVVDSQVHIWSRPNAEFPWKAGFLDQLPADLRHIYTDHDHTDEELLADMRGAGVDHAILTSPWLYGDDPAYCLAAADRHPSRFAVVVPLPLASERKTDFVRALSGRSDVVGVRLLLAVPDRRRGAAPVIGAAILDALDQPLTAAAEAGLTVFISPMGRHEVVSAAAARFPDLTFVLDHLGLWLDADIDTRLALVDDVLRLAEYPNVYLKCSAVQELSRDPYPFEDIWPLLHKLIGEFGAQRLMWASDINQHRHSLSYRDSIDYLRLSNELGSAQKAHILGGTAVRLHPAAFAP